MQAKTRDILLEAWAYCDINDKSTEFMLQYMQDMAGVNFDCVMNFIEKTTDEERTEFGKRTCKKTETSKLQT